MKMSEQFSSLFSFSDSENDYEEEKRKHKQRLVRNEFERSGKYGIPLIKKQNIDLDKIELLSWLKTKNDDVENKNKTIHFFYIRLEIRKCLRKTRNSTRKVGPILRPTHARI